MKPLLIFILKIIASLLSGIIGWLSVIIALILWNDKFMEISDITVKLIWEKTKK